ncbi:MAG: short chain dehydrogenase [Burkholderiales bacterium RIFCSPHIGHO2_12_FULL_69_20]|nr:MAG: short chain dehydrogenase [Burkholderiales bacterium RIFCSPHIGHO2_12_FULL_69_20]
MKGKTIFITGGNDGIGLATAQVFAQLGANVAIMGRRAESNQTAKVALESLGASCIAVTGDVAVEADIMRALEQTMAAFGRLDYAFNNAGIEQVPKPLPEQTEADYYKLFDVNVKGVWLCMKHEIPLMLRSGGGAIVNDSSASGLHGTKMMPLYSAAKHAVLGLTKSVALEYAKQGIRVNAVCPGAVTTPGYEKFVARDAVLKAAIENVHPMGRVGRAEEVASAVLYLCRDATFTTGSWILTDGGRMAQ